MARQLREQEVLEVLLRQGAVIPCFRCRKAFTMEDLKSGNIENEHLHERGLDGSDDPNNRAFSHRDPCHNLVTHGNGATWAGSSRHRIAKATEPERIAKFKVNKRPLDADLVSEPSGRCHRCGQEPCECVQGPRRPAFGGRR